MCAAVGEQGHMTMSMDVRKYLDRIGFGNNEVRHDLKTLKRLQNCHQLNVPYENMDTMTGVNFSLK